MIHLLLLIVSAHSIHIPFYCKIRKTNCQQRPESTCCQHLSTTTATTTSDTTIDTLAHNDGVTELPKLKESVSILNSSEADIFEAVPSEIDEVYVKVTGENIETNFLTTTVKPEKYAPRFCLKLKFNCKLRSAHACCKYPLPPRDESNGPTTENSKSVKLPVRPTRIQIPPVANTVEKIKKRKSPFRRPLRTQQTNIEQQFNEDNIKEIKDSITENNKGKKAVKKDLKRPVRKSTIKRRRPVYSANNKSTVCRIINCTRNKNHKCCQKPKEKTTTDNSLPTFTTETFEATQYVEMFTERENNIKIEKNSPLTKEELVKISKTSPSTESLPRDLTNSIVIKNLSKYQDPQDNNHPGDANNITNEPPTTEQGETNSDEDTTMKMEYQTLLTSNIQDNKTDVENQFKPDENLDFEDDTQYQNANQPMYNKINETKNINANYETFREEESYEEKSAPYLTTTDQTKAMSDYSIYQSDTFKLTDNLHFENEELSNTIKSISSLIDAEDEVIEDDYPLNVNDYLKYIIYEDNEQVEAEEETSIKNMPVVPYNTIDQPVVPYDTLDKESLLEPNQILPRVSVECFRYSCLSEPHHDCCNPHTTDKRHTRPLDTDDKQLVDKIIEDNHDRVTHTITRVMKTVRW